MRKKGHFDSTSRLVDLHLNNLFSLHSNTQPNDSESLTLRDLSNCSVYVLDHSSEVEASNCRDCQIFVGPVDGAAIFDSCEGCTVAVASQQFQARGCEDVEFGLYCATAPTVRGCKGVKVGCWVSENFGFFHFSFSIFFRDFSSSSLFFRKSAFEMQGRARGSRNAAFQ